MVGDARALVLFFGSVRRGEYDSLLDAGLPLGLLRDTTSPNSSTYRKGSPTSTRSPSPRAWTT
ncbi:MAG TPA: hypothetical protein VKP11_07440 [Frankiaceae bacterium]|nr:hypothetical protein [Frankiaceae bacterium]